VAKINAYGSLYQCNGESVSASARRNGMRIIMAYINARGGGVIVAAGSMKMA